MTAAPLVGAGRRHRASWTVSAQVLSSVSNAAMQLGLAAVATAAQFGALVVGLGLWFLALFLGRAWVGDPLVALSGPAEGAPGGRGQDPVGPGWRDGRRRVLVLGAVAGAAIGVWATTAPAAQVRVELGMLAVTAPLLALQDAYRYQFWARHRARAVAAIDGVWLAGTLAALPVAVVFGDAVLAVMGTWLAGGLASLALARHLAPAEHRPAAGAYGAGETGGAAGWALPSLRALRISQSVLAVESSALPLALSVGAGTVVAGGLRAAVLPFLPVITVSGALRLLTLPELRAGAERGGFRAATVAAVGSAAGSAFLLGTTGLLVVHTLPPAWLGQAGAAVLGWYWLGALVVGTRAVTVSLADALAVSAPAGRVSAYRLATSALDWTGALVGASAGGVAGALGGRAVAGGAGAALWVIALAVGARHRREVGTGPPSTPWEP